MGPGRVDLSDGSAADEPMGDEIAVRRVGPTRTRQRLGSWADAVSDGLIAVAVLLIAIRQTGIAVGPTASMLALLPWAGVCALAAAVHAACRRRLPQAVMAVAVTALVSTWWAPMLQVDGALMARSGTAQFSGSGMALASPARTMRVVSLNTMSSPAAAADFLRTLPQMKPDVVVLSELTLPTAAVVRRSGITRTLPYVTQPGVVDGLGMWSRWPVADVSPVPVRYGGYRVTLLPPHAAPLTLIVVHPLSPRWFAAREWALDQAVLHREVAAVSGPVVLVGDLNMTRDHLPFRRLQTLGVRDVSDIAGAGWSPTWSLGVGRPHIVAVDHIMVRGLKVASARTVDAQASDHRAVAADLVLPARSAS